MEERRLLKQMGGAVFGAALAGVISGSIESGVGLVFAPLEEVEEWGFSFWGSHHLLRVMVSLIASALGAFAAGCIAKSRGNVWGLISTLPSMFLWILTGTFALIWRYPEHGSVILTASEWTVILLLVIVIPFVGYCAGSLGASTRLKRPDIFEARSRLLLGITWYHWLWLVFVIHWFGMLATLNVYQGLYLLLGAGPLAFEHNMGLTVGAFLVGISLSLLGLGLYKILYLLMLGHKTGIARGQIALRIAGWVSVTLILAFAFQVITGLVIL